MTEPKIALKETDMQISRHRAAEKRWTRISWIFILLLTAELILCLIGHPPALVAIVAVLIGILAAYLRLNQLSANIRSEQDRVICQVLDNTLEQVARYDSKGQIDPYIVRHTDMGLPSFRQMQGSDLLQARYRGHIFSWSNLVLIRTGATEAGGSRKTKTAVFSGCWFNLQTGNTYPAPLTVSSISDDARAAKGTVLTSGNPDFDKRFLLRSGAPEQAAAMVTPQLMQLAESLADRHGMLHLHLAPNGLIQLAVPREAPLLSREYPTSAELQQHAAQDVIFLTEQLDLVITALCPEHA